MLTGWVLLCSGERNPSSDIYGPLCLSVWTAAYCSINDPPLNGGVINRTKLRPGSRLLYYCNRGYRLVGSSNATCRLYPNGLFQWDTPPPICQGKDFRLVSVILVTSKQKLGIGGHRWVNTCRTGATVAEEQDNAESGNCKIWWIGLINYLIFHADLPQVINIFLFWSEYLVRLLFLGDLDTLSPVVSTRSKQCTFHAFNKFSASQKAKWAFSPH